MICLLSLCLQKEQANLKIYHPNGNTNIRVPNCRPRNRIPQSHRHPGWRISRHPAVSAWLRRGSACWAARGVLHLPERLPCFRCTIHTASWPRAFWSGQRSPDLLEAFYCGRRFFISNGLSPCPHISAEYR